MKNLYFVKKQLPVIFFTAAIFCTQAIQAHNTLNNLPHKVKVSALSATGLTVNAGQDQTINRKKGFTFLNGVVNQPSAVRVWRLLNPVNGHPEIANIKSPKTDTTGVIILPFDPYNYFDFELTATYNSVTLKDTVRVNISYGTFPPQVNGMPIRMATAADIAAIPGCTSGDAVITGANDGSAPMHDEIYFSIPSGISIGPGHKLLIAAGQYTKISLYFGPGQIKGTAASPVIITNYGGQVEFTEMVLQNAEYAKVTGKYVAGVSGNVNYQGHANGDYAFSRGKYGFYGNASWQSIIGVCFSLKGTKVNHVEVEYMEVGNGNFGGFIAKEGSTSAQNYVALNYHDNYVHNTSGEGFYWGDTGGGATEVFDSATISNNRIIFTGNELLQFGRQHQYNSVKNNAMQFGGMRTKSAFERYYQGNGIQIGAINGKNDFKNNLVRGAGDQIISLTSKQDITRFPSNNDTIHVKNNLLDYPKGFIGNYAGTNDPVPGVRLNFSGNIMGHANFKGDSVYKTSSSSGINTNQMLRTLDGEGSVRFPVTLKNNIRDGSKTVYSIQGNPFDSSGNTSLMSIPDPQFVNSGWPDNFNVQNMEYWADSLFTMWKDESGNDNTTKQYEKVYYKTGDNVSFLNNYYVSNINGNTGHMPAGITDAYWTKLTWSDGVTTYDYPPDDYRLKAGDYYNNKNIGLLDNLKSGANQLPIVNAGADKVIVLPTSSVNLTGSASDPDGTLASTIWTIASGGTATITPAASLTTTISALTAGIYKFVLTVTDNVGAIARDTVQVMVNPAPNMVPTASAGVDKLITLPVNFTTLTGSGTDTDGTITSYAWVKLSGPSAGTIASPNAATTTLNSLVQGVYSLQLSVTDNNGAIGKDTVQVTVNPASNQAPLAGAGSDIINTLPASSANLNGTGTDMDGTISSYSWTKISGPSSGTIASPNTASTNVNSLVQGVYQFALMVTDNNAATGKDTVQVTVNAAANQTPSANAGNDIIITLPANSTTLTGSGTDVDGTISSYLWAKISGPSAGTIASPNAATTVLNSLVQGVYILQLSVIDNNGGIGNDTVQVTVNAAANQPPVSRAGNDVAITLPANTVTLNGSGTDADGSISNYAWSKMSGPASGTILNPSAASTNINSLQQGIYQYVLTVTDNGGLTAKDTVKVTVNAAGNLLPVSKAGSDMTITLPTNTVTLNGSGTDAGGTISAYKWRKVSGPFIFFSFSGKSSAQIVIKNLVKGVFKFELTVTDNMGATGKDTMQVTVNSAASAVAAAEADDFISVKNIKPVSIGINRFSLYNNMLTLTINSKEQQIVTVSIVDVSGRIFFKSAIPLNTGINAITKFIPGLYTGVFYINLFTNDSVIAKPVFNRE